MSSKPLPSTRRAKRGRIEFPIVYMSGAELVIDGRYTAK